jgi:hypothetical protein
MDSQPHRMPVALPPPDRRIAFGERCTWWGSIDEVAAGGLRPCCPHCRGPLLALPSIDCWNQTVDVQDAIQPGYKAFIAWLRGHCYPTLLVAEAAYWTAREVTAREHEVPRER